MFMPHSHANMQPRPVSNRHGGSVPPEDFRRLAAALAALLAAWYRQNLQDQSTSPSHDLMEGR